MNERNITLSALATRVILCLCLCLALPHHAWSQKKIVIKNFYLEENDMDAKTSYPKLDPVNGEICAIIKLQSGEDGFKFDLGSMVPAAVEKHTGETWIYVPPKARHLKILHNLLGNSEQFDFNVPIESGRVYIMNVQTDGGTGRYIQEADATGRFVEFFVTPATAALEVAGNLLVLENGYATKFLEYGQYEYIATAKNYHNLPGKLTVDRSSNENIRLRINLRPNFGFLTLECDEEYNGAQVFLDNVNVGILPFKSDEVASGVHKLRIAKNMYKTYEQDVVIQDGQTLNLSPKLIANFARTTLEVDADADIYVNGQRMGTRKWTGALEVGNYKVECRQEHHETVSQNISISDNKESRTFTLLTPIPIQGGLRITSSVPQAEVYVDGQKVGTTPFYNPRSLIGNHTVSIRKEGYGTVTETVEVIKGATIDKNFTLDNILKVRLSSFPIEAKLFVDGVERGKTPCDMELPAGKHTVKMQSDSYYTLEETVNFDDSKTYNFTLMSSLAEIRVESNKNGSLYIDNKYQGSLPMTVKLPHGNHVFEGLMRSRRLYGKKSIDVNASTKHVYIDMKKNLVQKNSFYVEPMIKMGTFMGFGGNMGFFINKINAEVSLYVGSSDKQEIAWYYNPEVTNTSGYASSSTYKASKEISAKIGYAINLGRKFRMTPQIGVRDVQIEEQNGSMTDNLLVLTAVTSLRMSLMLVKGIAVTAVPEFQFSVKEGEGYKVLKEVSPEMKKWCNGFNCFFGISFYL